MKALVPIVGYEKFPKTSTLEQRLFSIIDDKGYSPIKIDSGNILSIHKADHREISVPIVLVASDGSFSEAYIQDIINPIKSKFTTTVVIEERSTILPSILTQNYTELTLWKKPIVSKILRIAISYCFESISNAELSIEDIAYNTFVSLDKLERLFHKEFGYGIWQFVIQMRLEQAARLLCESDLSIGDIGDAIGYPDRSVFDRIFRKKLGESPKIFRQKVKISR
jgi:AraC-like DNA-binding protein